MWSGQGLGPHVDSPVSVLCVGSLGDTQSCVPAGRPGFFMTTRIFSYKSVHILIGMVFFWTCSAQPEQLHRVALMV